MMERQFNISEKTEHLYYIHIITYTYGNTHQKPEGNAPVL